MAASSRSSRARSRSRPPLTPTCSTPTTSSPRSSTCACGSPPASSRPRGCSRPRPARAIWRRGSRRVGRGPGLLILDGLLAVETRVADRTSTELLGAGDLLQPPGPACRRHDRATCASGGRCARRGSRCSTPSSPSACGRGRRSPHRCCAGPAGAADLGVLRAISSSRGSRSGWCCCSGTSRRAGGASSRRASACRCRSPTACSVSSWPPSGRRSRTRSAAVARGPRHRPAGDWHLHGSLEHQLER